MPKGHIDGLVHQAVDIQIWMSVGIAVLMVFGEIHQMMGIMGWIVPPPKLIHWSPKPQYLRLCTYLETGSLSVSSVTQLCPTLCDPMDCSTPGFPVHHQLPEPTQTHVHCIGDAIHLSQPLSSPSPATFSLSQHQGLFQRVSSSHQGGQSIGVSASASVLPMNIQDWFPIGWTGWIFLQSKDSQESFPIPQFKSIKSSVLKLSL